MNNDFVKEGYNKAAEDYATTRDQFESITYLKEFSKHVGKGKTVLDVGCGPGKPVDSFLVEQGFAVNGIDISPKMIELAKKNVPQAFYEIKDMSTLQEGEYCVDGIVSFYAIFHTPREKHQELLKKFASFMPNGGMLLITMGQSHFDAEKNTELVTNAGFTILFNEIDGSANEKHQVVLAKL